MKNGLFVSILSVGIMISVCTLSPMVDCYESDDVYIVNTVGCRGFF